MFLDDPQLCFAATYLNGVILLGPSGDILEQNVMREFVLAALQLLTIILFGYLTVAQWFLLAYSSPQSVLGCIFGVCFVRDRGKEISASPGKGHYKRAPMTS